ncbi:MAG: outer membrane protein transport protein [Ideonella sp.]|nr:outer membrane protein transport protein [Ideonella sp.]
MNSFRMSYATDGKTGMDGSISFALPQLWKDQTVLHLGVQHRPSPQWAVRAGLNLASNAVPDAMINPLFPAIVERHYTAGVGYKLEDAGEINAAITLAPKATANTPQGVVISHRQLNGQLMYSHPF